MDSANDKPKGFNALKYPGIKPRKVFLKNEKYECQGTVVVCIETTCSYSSPTFKAVYIGQTGQYLRVNGGTKFETFFGTIWDCACSNYTLYDGEITL